MVQNIVMGLLVTMIQNVLLLGRGAPKDKIEKKIDDCKIKGREDHS